METIKEFIEDNIESKQHIQDIAQYGHNSLTFLPILDHAQTHEFFDKHYAEIMWLLGDYKEETGNLLDDIVGDRDLRGQLAWFAIERVAAELLANFEDEGW